MTKVLIVEDQRMAQENMEAIIKSSENYTLAGIIPNAADAELFCMRESVDLVLMDVCTARDENGIEACAVIKKKFKQIKDLPDSYVVNDDVEIGMGNKIPLWLFGFLY